MTFDNGGPRVASAISTHPVAAAAAGEVIGEVLDGVGMNPELVLVFVSGGHVEFVGELSATVRRVLRPRTTVTVTGEALLGSGIDVEGNSGVLVWATTAGPVGVHVLNEAGLTSDGSPPNFGPSPSAVVVLSTAADWPSPELLGRWASNFPNAFITGATPTAQTRFVMVGDRRVLAGGVALVFGDGAPVSGLCVSRTRPVGPVMTATAVRGRAIVELDGIGALRRLEQALAELDQIDRDDLRRNVLVGISLSHAAESEFVVSQVLGSDRQAESLILDHGTSDGTRVQLRVVSNDQAGRNMLDAVHGTRAKPIVGALTFIDGAPPPGPAIDSDAALGSYDEWRGTLSAGLYSGGVIGSLGGRTRVHRHALSALIVHQPQQAQSKT